MKKTREIEKETTAGNLISETLRESEERYRNVYHTAPLAFVIWDLDCLVTDWNNHAEKLFGWSRQEIIGRNFFEFLIPDTVRPRVQEVVDALLQEKLPSHSINENLTKNGKIVLCEWNNSILYDDNGDVKGVMSLALDITQREKTEESLRKAHAHLEKKVKARTAELIKINNRLKEEIEERKLVEEAFRESETQLKAILDATMDRIRYVDKEMRIIWANKASLSVVSSSPVDIIGRCCYEIYANRDTPCDGCSCNMARETGRIEKSILCKASLVGRDEESFWATYCVPLKNERGKINRYIQIARDITEEKQSQDQIHALTQQLLRAQENERQKISHDLHDVIGQNLSALKIGCDELLNRLNDTCYDRKLKVRKFSKLLQETINETRNLAYDLRPPELDQLGLNRTLDLLCENFSNNTKIKTKFISSGMDGVQLDFDTEINLYRLIQEALNNINKHSKAESVNIKLVACHPNLILRIEDNGSGFDIRQQRKKSRNRKSMGLSTMEQRVKLLDGKINIESVPMKGTKISIELLIKEKKYAHN